MASVRSEWEACLPDTFWKQNTPLFSDLKERDWAKYNEWIWGNVTNPSNNQTYLGRRAAASPSLPAFIFT